MAEMTLCGRIFPPQDYTRGGSPASIGFRGINAYVFQGAKNIVLKNSKIFYYRGNLHTILDLTLRRGYNEQSKYKR